MNDTDFTIDPLHDYVVIRVMTKEKTEGGILLPDSAKVDAGMKVVSKGSECKTKIRVGDFVILTGKVMTVKDSEGRTTEFALVQEKDILAIKKFK